MYIYITIGITVLLRPGRQKCCQGCSQCGHTLQDSIQFLFCTEGTQTTLKHSPSKFFLTSHGASFNQYHFSNHRRKTNLLKIL